MHTWEWIKAPDTENTFGIYLVRGGVKYPLAIIEFSPVGLGVADLESLLQAAPDLFEACDAALTYLNEHLPMAGENDTLRAAIAKARGGDA